MNFLNPLLLLGALGIGLPILAHMLNRFEVKHTDWAAMQFLNRSVRVRSRQLRLRDVILLILRCLAMLLLILAITRPSMKSRHALVSALGEKRAGVVIALDASFSMQHRDGTQTRFERALEKVESIADGIRTGDSVTLILLGAEHRTVIRNAAFDADAFAELLGEQKATSEALHVDSVPRILKELAAEMKAPEKEIHIVTDMQEQDWKPRSIWLQESLKDLARNASVFLVPIEGGPENLAITGLELVSGVLRKGTSARYRATVRNCGANVAQNVRVTGLLNRISVDVKVIPVIAPGTSETVSLFFPFRDPGPVKIAAELSDDALAADNTRQAVAVIRDRVSVLCVEGSDGDGQSAGRLIAAALRARDNRKVQDDLAVRSVSWVDLPSQDLKQFDVVILADVPDITVEQARSFERFVRAGNGLIWFAGDYVKADAWNQRSALEGSPLLPGTIEEPISTIDAMGIGRSLDPSLTDHPVCRPLLSLAEDLLSETRFRTMLRVKPSATSTKVLSLAGSDSPLLLEHSLGRGHVFMFTTSAGSAWNNMAVTPVFPMLLQQMVTYLTGREFETPRTVGDTLSLSYVEQPDATDAVFDTPAGETITVPVREYRNQYVALLGNAREAGFYLARVSLQAAGMPIAVNVDTRESMVKSMLSAETKRILKDSGVRVVRSSDEILAGMEESRESHSLWRILMMAGLAFFVIESLFAQWMSKRSPKTGENH
ncbi:MAG: VWA domain-containing protein [Verrucomicrobia bacterium]|nr:VWA domain-containing protein [Verrucomicrobiota bacterium]MBT7067354.1 VWA domain-containing protein [Verrucomicrobiota bacterium]MBT7702113.1 VWA domain-containing protein [Verrucomicrobiota bacterium]